MMDNNIELTLPTSLTYERVNSKYVHLKIHSNKDRPLCNIDAKHLHAQMTYLGAHFSDLSLLEKYGPAPLISRIIEHRISQSQPASEDMEDAV